jgi:hypothetical protein
VPAHRWSDDHAREILVACRSGRRAREAVSYHPADRRAREAARAVPLIPILVREYYESSAGPPVARLAGGSPPIVSRTFSDPRCVQLSKHNKKAMTPSRSSDSWRWVYQ